MGSPELLLLLLVLLGRWLLCPLWASCYPLGASGAGDAAWGSNGSGRRETPSFPKWLAGDSAPERLLCVGHCARLLQPSSHVTLTATWTVGTAVTLCKEGRREVRRSEGTCQKSRWTEGLSHI